MKILMILSNSFVFDARVYYETEALVKAGHEITVLAWDRGNNCALQEKRDGVSIVRIPNINYPRILNHDFLKLKYWRDHAFRKAIDIYKTEKFDIVHCHDFDTLSVGVRLKKELGIFLVYDAHEIWGYIHSMIPLRLLRGYFLRQERKLLRSVDRIITVSQPLKDYFDKFSKTPALIIMNCKPIGNPEYESPANDNVTFLYVGVLDQIRFITGMIDAVKPIPDVSLIIGGVGKKSFIEKMQKRITGSGNIKFVGSIALTEVLTMTRRADVVVCMLDPKHKLARIGLPNKFFESLVCGRPIIVSKNTYLGDLVDKLACGLAIGYGINPLRQALIKLRDDAGLRTSLGKNALEQARKEFNWQAQRKLLIDFYNTLLSSN